MRILWLSPWLRTLARVQIDALRDAGHECLLVTTDQHWEAVAARPDERVLDPRIKHPGNLAPLVRVWREAARWQPELVVSELVHDPRWLPLTRLGPLAHVVHDDRPHDANETRPSRRRAVLDHLTRTADAVVAPSAHVGAVLSARFGRRVDVVPLTSDLPDDAVPYDVPVPAADRRDVVLVGRMSPYKNVGTTLRAWRAHTRSADFRGDRLILIGGGSLDVPTDLLDSHVEWRRERFSYADVVPTLAHAKASVAHYRTATQSGVQLLSMQLGVPVVVSDAGGLPEFAPPDSRPVAAHDVDGLTAVFGSLADPATAAARGAEAAAHYRDHFSAPHGAAAWGALAERLARRGRQRDR